MRSWIHFRPRLCCAAGQSKAAGIMLAALLIVVTMIRVAPRERVVS